MSGLSVVDSHSTEGTVLNDLILNGPIKLCHIRNSFWIKRGLGAIMFQNFHEYHFCAVMRNTFVHLWVCGG